jgi:hypothetical protein
LSAAEGGVASMDRLRAPSTDRDFLFSAYLGLAALLPRLYVAIAFSREPVWDGHYYDFGARRIAAGFGYSDGNGGWHPWCHWPVGYSGVLAAAYRIFGTGAHVATVLGAFVGALLAVFTHRLARYELSPWRARAAGLLTAFYPGLVIYAALVMTETLSALAIVVAGWLWVRDRHDHPRRSAVLFGLTIGAGALVHPSFLAYAPAVFFLSSSAPRGVAGRDAPRVLALATPAEKSLGQRDRNSVRAGARLAVDAAQLSGDGPLHAALDQRRVEPRDWFLLARDRSLRDVALLRRLRRRHRSGATRRMLARPRFCHDTGRRGPLARPRSQKARLHVRSRIVRYRIPP